MRRVLALAAVLVAAAAFAPFASPAGGTLNANFQLFFGKATAHPCAVPGAFICGTGTVGGLGSATTYMVITGGEVISSTCLLLTVDETITLSDGSGTLTLAETGTFCAPSAGAVRIDNGLKSFGNPFSFDLTYTVVSGTGVFAGASGTGSVTGAFAGDSGHKSVSGTM